VKRVLVTRDERQSAGLAAALRARGFEPVQVGLLRVRPARSWAELDAALRRLPEYACVCFTSANAVDACLERVSGRRLGAARLAAVGEATAARLRSVGLTVDVVPPRATAADLAQALGPRLRPGDRVLWPCGERAGRGLPDGLTAFGVTVEAVVAYRVELDPAAEGRLERALARGLDALTLASGAQVEALADLQRAAAAMAVLRQIPAVCIGPVTAGAARAAGFRVAAVADRAGGEAVAEALAKLFGG